MFVAQLCINVMWGGKVMFASFPLSNCHLDSHLLQVAYMKMWSFECIVIFHVFSVSISPLTIFVDDARHSHLVSDEVIRQLITGKAVRCQPGHVHSYSLHSLPYPFQRSDSTASQTEAFARTYALSSPNITSVILHTHAHREGGRSGNIASCYLNKEKLGRVSSSGEQKG